MSISNGILCFQTPWLLALIFSYCEDLSTSLRWRLILGLGAVPAGLVVACSVAESYQLAAAQQHSSAQHGARLLSLPPPIHSTNSHHCSQV